jgi:uracil-DNA glycosylase
MSQEFSVGSRNQNWAQLRSDVKNCRFTTCPRNSKKLPLLFERKEDTISNIRFIVLSQEPSPQLRCDYNNNPQMMENYLIKECSNIEPPKRRSGLPARIREVFDKKFNPTTDEIYWTHSLKCVPDSNQDIKKDDMWVKCAQACKGYFKREIELIPSESLVLIPFGNYALALCRHVLQNTPLSDTEGITKYMRERATPDSQEKKFLGRVLVFPFIHPSHRRQHLKRQPCLAKIEESFVKKIREMNYHSSRA